MRISIILFLFYVMSCTRNNQEENINTQIVSIESKLAITEENYANASKRLARIDSAISVLTSVKKKPAISYFDDTVSINSSFKADVVIASHQSKSLPFAILKSNDGIDTIKFNLEFDCFLIEIDSIVEGINEYEGVIFENEHSYPFKGWFIGKY